MLRARQQENRPSALSAPGHVRKRRESLVFQVPRGDFGRYCGPMDALTQPLRDGHTLDPADLAAMADALAQSTDYRVLRRLIPRSPYTPAAGQEVRTGILLDTETTGLDHAKDEIIELGMVAFDYTADGRIVGVRDTFSAFNEPSAPISAEVTALTGITNEMAAGHKFDDAAVTAFVESGVITIAH